MKKLPIGIQTYERLITEGYYYVDKTRFMASLADEGVYYFLSRPRRFGKSLLVSTIKAAYEAKKELFAGTYLYEHWDWSAPNPVIHISLGSGVIRSLQELHVRFDAIVRRIAAAHEVQLEEKDFRERFIELIFTLYKVHNRKVVVLIDEYDKPILDNIHDQQTAIVIREELKNYYSVLKDSDPYLEFVFITGVSKFSKVSLFSGLNNLNDITLDARYSAICGYTQQELEAVFGERLQGVDMPTVRRWYNGYSWLGENVYNPFDILLYLGSGQLANYWFETATPTFLVKLLAEKQYYIPALENLRVSEKIIGSFDVDRLEVETLLFQTGYLTIKTVRQMAGMRRFELGYPNQEVKQSLTDYILTYLTDLTVEAEENKVAVYEALEANDLDGLGRAMQAFFASIPHHWYTKNEIARYEGYYASIVYCYFAALGVDVSPEEPTNKGRIDLVVRFAGRVYLIEFKVLELAEPGRALEQIKERGYAQKYAGQETYLIGVEFSKDTKNIERFEWEREEE
ncbi:MAG: AAA family ATPase [Desulfovermiculus sp.]